MAKLYYKDIPFFFPLFFFYPIKNYDSSTVYRANFMYLITTNRIVKPICRGTIDAKNNN